MAASSLRAPPRAGVPASGPPAGTPLQQVALSGAAVSVANTCTIPLGEAYSGFRAAGGACGRLRAVLGSARLRPRPDRPDRPPTPSQTSSRCACSCRLRSRAPLGRAWCDGRRRRGGRGKRGGRAAGVGAVVQQVGPRARPHCAPVCPWNTPLAPHTSPSSPSPSFTPFRPPRRQRSCGARVRSPSSPAWGPPWRAASSTEARGGGRGREQGAVGCGDRLQAPTACAAGAGRARVAAYWRQLRVLLGLAARGCRAGPRNGAGPP